MPVHQTEAMTHKKRAPHLTTRPLLVTGSGLAALALLAGCATEQEDPAAPAPEGGETAAPEEGAADGQATDDQATDDQGGETATDDADMASPTETATGPGAPMADDPVFGAIEAVLAEYPEGVITAIDRDDDDNYYEIDVVDGEELVELEVDEAGDVVEDERDDGDDDDIQYAAEATVTVEEAITTALDGRENQTVDDVELEEDDGTLRWEIDLDDEQGEDADEVHVDARTGDPINN